MIIDKTKEIAQWGRTCLFADISEDKSYIRVHGHWTPTPENGDIIITEMESGRIAKLELFDIYHPGNPKDQYFGKAKFIKYLDKGV